MNLRPLYAPRDFDLVAGWLARKENYQWLDFGNGLQVLTPALLVIMARRATHFLRVYTAERDDTPIGLVGLHGIDPNFRTATFWGLSGDKSFRNRGNSTYASSRLMSLAFNELGLTAVNAWAVEGNPSNRTLERLGFRYVGRQRRCHVIDGQVRDRLLYDLLASEHRELAAPARRASPQREQTEDRMRSVLRRALALSLSIALAGPACAQTGGEARPARFIPTFLAYYGGGRPFGAEDAARLAKYDLLDVDRFRFADIGGGTWAAAKALNPSLQIYLYQMGPEAPNFLDATAPVVLNGLGRHDVSRGHPMGSLNGDRPDLFLRDAAGNRIYNGAYSDPATNRYWNLMDFGSADYQAYWLEGVRADIVAQPWAADGVHADNCLAVPAFSGYSATPAAYPTDAQWAAAMNGFAATIAGGLRANGQKLWCNRGGTRSAAGAEAWLALDQAATPPDVVAEEGAFAVAWGPWSTQFFPEEDWKRQVDTVGAINRSKVAVFSHSALAPDGAGTDNWGRPVTYWQSFWYALGSFLLARNDDLNNAYFNFFGNGAAHDTLWWAEEFERIDLGRALGPYAVAETGGARIYWREFERGYVLVNPTPADATGIVLPRPCRALSHADLGATGAAVEAVALGAHSAAILLKD